MSTQIGEVNINLRMSLVQFQKDVRDGTAAAGKAAQEMSSEIGNNAHEATGSLALLGEQFGVVIPRHLRTFIAEIPGVGQALSAAFNSVAIIALIGVLVELIQKTREYYEKLGELDEEQKKYFDAATKGAETQLDYQKKLMKGEQDLATARAQGLSKDQQRVKNAQDELDLITKKGSTEIADLSRLQSELAVQKQIMAAKQTEIASEGDTPSVLALGQFEVAQKKAEGISKAIEKLQSDMKLTGSEALSSVAEITDAENTVSDAGTKAAEKLNNLQVKLREIDATVLKFLEDSKVPSDLTAWAANPNVTAGLEVQAKWLQEQLTTLQQMVALPPTHALPVYGGTAQAKELADIQTDLNERLKQAQDVFTQTRTAGENFTFTIQKLNELLGDGAIDWDTYTRAVKQAFAQQNTTGKAVAQLGQDIGKTLIDVAEYGNSWSDALKAVGIEVAQLIIQMTLLKALQAESGQGGVTGFFANLATGFAGGGHRAMGGPVEPSKWYTVGEQGPEVFVPRTSGSIIPNHALAGAGGKAAQHITQNTYISTPDANSFRRSEKQISSRMFRDAAAAHGRYR